MFADLVKAFMNVCAGFFSWRTTSIENQTASEVIKDKRDLESACESAEQAFDVVARGAVFAKSKYRRRYVSLVRRFRRLR